MRSLFALILALLCTLAAAKKPIDPDVEEARALRAALRAEKARADLPRLRAELAAVRAAQAASATH